jgi:hypothetical protein
VRCELGVALTEPPLWVEAADEPVGPSLDEAVMRVLADPAGAPCLVCGGHVWAAAGGADCEECGSEIRREDWSRRAWVA